MTQYNTFFVPIADGGEAQQSLNAFLRSHRVLQVETNVFASGWGFCVEWVDGGVAVVPGQREKIDYMKELPPEVFARFSELRKRRKAIAATDGVATYMVMTDAQLASIAKIENPTTADIRKIDGIGDARIEKYADRLLSPPTDASGQ